MARLPGGHRSAGGGGGPRRDRPILRSASRVVGGQVGGLPVDLGRVARSIRRRLEILGVGLAGELYQQPGPRAFRLVGEPNMNPVPSGRPRIDDQRRHAVRHEPVGRSRLVQTLRSRRAVRPAGRAAVDQSKDPVLVKRHQPHDKAADSHLSAGRHPPVTWGNRRGDRICSAIEHCPPDRRPAVPTSSKEAPCLWPSSPSR